VGLITFADFLRVKSEVGNFLCLLQKTILYTCCWNQKVKGTTERNSLAWCTYQSQ